jgi:hypothetical protein
VVGSLIFPLLINLDSAGRSELAKMSFIVENFKFIQKVEMLNISIISQDFFTQNQ